MKANMDDAPEHIKRKRKSSIGVAGITAVGLILGILFMAERNGWMDLAKRIMDPLGQNQQSVSIVPPPTSSQKTEALLWEAAKAEQQKPPAPAHPPARQTSFNDSNYQPKRIINTIQPPPQQYAQAHNQSSNRQQQGLNGRSDVIYVKWKDARGRTTEWLTSFTYQNSRIDNNSFCRNYQSGSIDYRTCRKGAKKWLKERCLSDSNRLTTEWRRMYCHAESSFRH